MEAGGKTGWRWVLGAWALGVATACWPTLVLGHSLGDAGDTRFVGYVLEHGYRWLRGDALLLDMPFFFPVRGVGAWSELMLPLQALYAPWRLAGLSPERAAQLWLLAVMSLNTWAAWRLLRGVGGATPFAAAVGCFVVCFGSPRLAQLNHQHLVGVFFALLAVEGAARWLTPSTRRPGPWLALATSSAALQVAAGLYTGFFLVLAFGLALPVLGSTSAGRDLLRGALGRSRWWLLLATLAPLPVLLPLLRVYLEAGGAHDFGTVRGYTPELHSWLHVGSEHWLYGWTSGFSLFQRLPSEGEHRIGVGLLTLGLAVAALWRARGTLAGRVVGVTALLLFLVALKWRWGFTPWQFVYDVVPGAKGLRVVARVGVFMLLPLGVAVAWALDAVKGRALALALGAVVVAEQLRTPPHFDPAVPRAAVARIAVPPGCAAFFWDAPGSAGWPFEYVQLDAMWAALEVGVPTVNGYTGREPASWREHGRVDVAAWERRHGLAPGTVCVLRP